MNKKIIAKKTRAINTFVQEISKKPESKLVERIILFGSVARGEADQESDIDLLIFGKQTKKLKELSDDIGYDILLKFGELIEPQVCPVSHFDHPKSYFVLRAIETGKKIYPNKFV